MKSVNIACIPWMDSIVHKHLAHIHHNAILSFEGHSMTTEVSIWRVSKCQSDPRFETRVQLTISPEEWPLRLGWRDITFFWHCKTCRSTSLFYNKWILVNFWHFSWALQSFGAKGTMSGEESHFLVAFRWQHSRSLLREQWSSSEYSSLSHPQISMPLFQLEIYAIWPRGDKQDMDGIPARIHRSRLPALGVFGSRPHVDCKVNGTACRYVGYGVRLLKNLQTVFRSGNYLAAQYGTLNTVVSRMLS